MYSERVEVQRFLIGFESLSELNALKRAVREVHLPMRHIPACLAKAGCGFAVVVTGDRLDQIVRVAAATGIRHRVFRIAGPDCGPLEYFPPEQVPNDLS